MNRFTVVYGICHGEGERITCTWEGAPLNFDDPDSAYEAACRAKGPDRAVILRPNYNEVDERGRAFFREWRSFNGGPLNECRWLAEFSNRYNHDFVI